MPARPSSISLTLLTLFGALGWAQAGDALFAAPDAAIRFPQDQDVFVAGEVIPFSSTGSLDAAGTITTWSWSFGDAATSSVSHPTHTYTTPGTYAVQLSVANEQGSWSPPVTISLTIQPLKPPIPPQWVFEPWVWQDDAGEQSERVTRDLVQDYLSRGIPTGAVIIDSPWERAYNDFVFRTDWFTDAQTLIDDLHAQDVRVILWITGYLNTQSNDTQFTGKVATYDQALAAGYFVENGKRYNWWKGTGSHIDFLNPDALAWWRSQMEPILDMGVDGWKVDMGTSAITDDPVTTWQGDVPRTRLTQQYYRDFYRTTVKRNPRGMITCRPVDVSSQATIDATPAGWVGDQTHTWGDDGLLRALSNVFQSGRQGYLAFGSDIGGYLGSTPAPKNLFIRWAQFGALCPIMENGGGSNHRPWSYDSQTVDIYRYFAKLHRELGPYLYTHAIEAQNTGLSLLRPEGGPADWPGDWRYRLGPDLLCAPLSTDTTSRDVRLPAGEMWIDYWNETSEYVGGTLLQGYAVPLNRTPILVRRGSIIPMDVRDAETGHGRTASNGHLTLLVNLAGSNAQNVHREDKPDVSVSFVPAPSGYDLTLGPTDVPAVLRLRSLCTWNSVQVNGTGIPQRTSLDNTIGSISSGWYAESAKGLCWVKLPASAAARIVALRSGTSCNAAPRVDAGPDRSIDLIEAAHLEAVALDDRLPVPPGALAFTWSTQSGPAAARFAEPNQPVTRAAFDAPGAYVLQCEITDGQLTHSDTTTVTVTANAALLARPKPALAVKGQAVTCTAMILHGPPDPQVVYAWTIRDPAGIVVHAGDAPTTGFIPALTGTYTVDLAATFTESGHTLTHATTVEVLGSGADFDGDDDVDAADQAHLRGCFTGASLLQENLNCQDADLDRDGDVDQEDFGLWQSCPSGSGQTASSDCLHPAIYRATNPHPPDLARKIPLVTSLHWAAPPDASAHHVYLGDTHPPLPLASGPQATLHVGPLKRGTTYLWQVDEVVADRVHPGDLWIFTTASNVGVSNLNRYESASLRTGSTYFVDRSYVITGMPGYLEGIDGIRTLNADKNASAASWIVFDSDVDTDVYIAFDSRATALPLWMAGYEDTGLEMMLSDAYQQTARLYRARLPAGTIVLGGPAAEGGAGVGSNYFVLLAPAGLAP